MANASTIVTIMINAARKAGRQLQRDFGEVEALQVSRKGAADFVSAADHAAEQTIFEELTRARPKYGYLMEERGGAAGADNSNRWIVDPIDGTTNFLHGLGQCAISICLERDRQPFAGVVYNPITDELFWAEKGEGAFLNERRLRVSARTDLSACLFATGLPFKGKPGRKQALAETERVLEGDRRREAVWVSGARSVFCGGGALRRLLGARSIRLGHWRRHRHRARSRRRRDRS